MSDLRYPCARCGVMRTKEHGGTVFTVCDACWTQDHGPSFPERLAAAIRERDAAIQRAALAEGKLRETTYAALAAREQGEADTVARIVAWLDDVEGYPIGAGTLRDFGLQDFANRVDAFRELFAGALRCGAWRGKEGA